MAKPSLPLSASLLFFLVFTSHTLFAAAYDNKYTLPPNVTIPAVLGFGDSIIDPGNNNFIATIVKSDFLPYGRNFEGGGHPNGRFSNGKIPTDFLAEELGLKDYLPPYLDPQLSPEDLLTGVSFASAASGYDPITPTMSLVLSMERQLDMFRQYIGKVKAMVGDERADFIIKNSLYVVVAGSNDIGNTYFLTPFRRFEYDSDAYTNLLLDSSSSFVQELYRLGARRIAVFGVPPVGCVPLKRTLEGGLMRQCSEETNRVAQMFNAKLSDKMSDLNSQLPESRITYVDIYDPLLDIIRSPSKYGVEQVDRGCCGTGLFEMSFLCNLLDPVCPDADKYLFWDGYHPTEKGYQLLTQMVLDKYLTTWF